jgi:FkbM family methyltransferase
LLINTATRFLAEYNALGRVLEPRDLLALAKATLMNGSTILQTKKLTALDAAMSRNMTVHVGKTPMVLPLADIDRILAASNDNPTFGNVRELYARNCYLDHLHLKTPLHAVLDLGANRGMFSLLALLALKAEIAVGVEPTEIYESVNRLLLEANNCNLQRGPRYKKFVSSPSNERQNPSQNVSIETIMREQKINRFSLVKMDIEGHEKEVFGEPEWLTSVDNITMELHPHFVGDLSLVPQALERFGFAYRMFDQAGKPADVKSAMFLYASCTGELAA